MPLATIPDSTQRGVFSRIPNVIHLFSTMAEDEDVEVGRDNIPVIAPRRGFSVVLGVDHPLSKDKGGVQSSNRGCSRTPIMRGFGRYFTASDRPFCGQAF